VRNEAVVAGTPSGKVARLGELLRSRRVEPGMSIAAQRAKFESDVARMPINPGAAGRPVDAGGVPAEWVEPDGAGPGAPVVLYLHGGGYFMGSLNTIRPLAANLAVAARARVLTVGYRLAPEHPFPAAVDDAVAAWRWLLDGGVDPAAVAFGGDSAGGGLTVAAMLAARERGLPLPAAAVCLSPWVDLTLAGESYHRNAATDPDVLRWRLEEMARHYLAGADPRSSLASPVFADLAGLPPLLVHAGTAEVLEDDAVLLAAVARAAGVPVTLELHRDMIHVWHAYAPGLPEAMAAIERIAAWLGQRWAAGRAADDPVRMAHDI
jgi:phosphinothricin tripeptide acetyl hydrolase